MKSVRFFLAAIFSMALVALTNRPAMAAAISPGCLGFLSPLTVPAISPTFSAVGPFYAGETLVITITTMTTASLMVGGVTVIPMTPTPATLTYTLAVNAADFQINAGAVFAGSIRCIPVPGVKVSNGITHALDDRLDRRWGVPLASYCRNDGFHFYLIDENSKGSLKLVITPEQLKALPEKPDQNTLIAESEEHIRVYKLTTGEYQVNYGPNANGDEYAWAWITCVPDEGTDHSFNIYHS
jgi:hypothetical protein